MSDPTQPASQPSTPTVTRNRRQISLVWAVPIVAALVGISMLVHAWVSAGPEITITFHAATGLEAGKTPVKYKDVTVGVVKDIQLSDDGSHVIASVSLSKSALSLTRKDTRFWVVRPRIGLGGVSGVDTLLSGAYVEVDRGKSQATSKHFAGLETPPTVVGDAKGKSFRLQTEDLGSLDIGSPVYYRRIQVGRVASYQLNKDGKRVDLQIFVDAPYDRYVTSNTRFWNASGVDVSLGADGLKLKTQSVATIVAGGVAFAAPDFDAGDVVPENTQFTLSADQATAMAPPDGPGQYIELRFDQSLRGLAVGASVQFSGIDIGHVVSTGLDYDPAKRRFPTVVGIVVFPQRLGHVLEKLPSIDGQTHPEANRFLGDMVAQGLRAQARSGNLITGQLYISLDFLPNAPKVAFDPFARPLVIPTAPGSLDQMQEQVASIVSKIQKIPLDSIGRNLDSTLADLDKTLKQVNGQVLPETTQTLQQAKQTFGATQSALAQDAPLQQNLSQTLEEVQRTARSLREVSDLLSRHPEALLRGRPKETAPKTVEPPKPATSQESSR